MDVEQFKDDFRRGRISPDRVADLVVKQQRELQSPRGRIAELEKKLGGPPTEKVTEPFSVQPEEKRQEARGKTRRKRKKSRRRGRNPTAEKSARAERTEKVFPLGGRVRLLSRRSIVELLVEHWRQVGLPGYAQFDNDNRFCGPKQHADVVGRVSRLCLSLRVTAVFAPPNETGFRAAIESFNGRWQTGVWPRFEHRVLRDFRSRSGRYVTAVRQKLAARIEAAPSRRAFPKRWRLNLQKHPQGTMIYIRRTDDHGQASLLGHRFSVDRSWLHRLVRAQVDLKVRQISFYAMRRRDPTEQGA